MLMKMMLFLFQRNFFCFFCCFFCLPRNFFFLLQLCRLFSFSQFRLFCFKYCHFLCQCLLLSPSCRFLCLPRFSFKYCGFLCQCLLLNPSCSFLCLPRYFFFLL